MRSLFILAVLILLYPNNYLVQAQKPGKKDEIRFTHHMSPEEKKLKHLIGTDFVLTPPPDGPIRDVAEFEKMQAVLIRYPFGISYSVIKEMSEDIIVVTLVEDQSAENYVLSQYNSNNVNTVNCEFLHAPSNSYWTRDYGPWFVFDGNDQPGIIDFPYNRPNRPDDDEVPVEVANMLGINLFGMNVIHTGGNYMTDGMGISSSSELVWEENSLTPAQIDQEFQDYLGINTYHVVPDPNNTYIDHIDCWGKFLDIDKVLIREVPSSHPQYDEIEATATYYAAQISSYGVPFQVIRVYTPNDEPYTNSLILNRKVLVPITGSQWDDEALQTYEEAMPGYEVIGMTGSWVSTDALHCRSKGIADIGMLYIKHIPLLADQPVQSQYSIEAEITAYSGQSIYPDSVFVIYSVNGADWDTIPMNNTSGKIYIGDIPGQVYGSQLQYYLYAADQSGRHATHPFIGSPDPHVFYVGEELLPQILAYPGEFNIFLAPDDTENEILTLKNIGGPVLNYQTAVSYTNKSDALVQANPASADYWTGSSTSAVKTETSLVVAYNDEDGWIKFDVSSIPVGAVVNSIELYAYVNDTYWPYWSVTSLPDDPVTASAGTLRNWIQSHSGTSEAYYYGNESQNFSTGWHSWSLGNSATVDLENGLAQGWFAVGIDSRDNDNQYYLIFDGWAESNPPYLLIDYSYTPAFEWLTLDDGSITSGTLAQQDSVIISAGFDATGLDEGVYTADITVTSNDPDQPQFVIPVTLTVVSAKYIGLKFFLQGPFTGTEMSTELNQMGLLPLNHPYIGAPWNFDGTENVSNIPDPDITDWILLEYRDAVDAASATPAKVIGREAAFLNKDGSVLALDGSPDLNFPYNIQDNLFIVVYHRNHLPVLSANPILDNGGIYMYDFSTGSEQVYGGNEAYIEIAPGMWGLPAGDIDASGMIDVQDIIVDWPVQAGTNGYLPADLNMDGQIDNKDKNDFWFFNNGIESQLPED